MTPIPPISNLDFGTLLFNLMVQDAIVLRIVNRDFDQVNTRSVKWKQENMGLKDFGLDYGNPDFVAYAESYGAQGHRPTSSAELLPLMTKCLDTPAVHLIEVPVDYSENDRILNHEFKEQSAKI